MMVMVIGKAEQNGDSLRIVVNEVHAMEKVRPTFAKRVILLVRPHEVKESAIAELKKLVERSKGKCACFFNVQSEPGKGGLRLQSTKYTVDVTDEFIREAEALLGRDAVRISQ
jgi:hypothetical protein